MKYIKTYSYNGYFYLIPYKDENLVKIAIKKINTSKEIINKILKDHILYKELNSQKTNNYNIGFFINIGNITFDNSFGYSHWVFKNNINFDKDAAYKYLTQVSIYVGEIKLEDWEITADKYNL